MHQVQANGSAFPQHPAADAVTATRNASDQALEDAMNTASEWEPLLHRLDAFARVTESMAEVRTTARLCYSVSLSLAGESVFQDGLKGPICGVQGTFACVHW
ncbi:hypothetical protein CALVIDRAFT_540497 [Calocera viscosa TUFC12733]|uniref:Uncharacterized protein n=1 Tax=Calocera viscosa (strain TUFC12733) TaxID=1330018 RepID=A0A167IWD5_CALVF|nr:hypothetical protein CALVIDRAFT_540497 [Calocera viscosa TUFC12733]